LDPCHLGAGWRLIGNLNKSSSHVKQIMSKGQFIHGSSWFQKMLCYIDRLGQHTIYTKVGWAHANTLVLAPSQIFSQYLCCPAQIPFGLFGRAPG
jgi:hypothetical protein